jgi:predicted ArsR family transcriptional regulator
MRKGSSHTADARRKIADAKRMPMADRVYRDALVLVGCGQATRHEFASRLGISPNSAYGRLVRLQAWGQAESYIVRGRRVFVPALRHDSVKLDLTLTRDEKADLARKYGL